MRFSYCFVSPPGSDYPPILDHHAIEAGESRTIEGKGGPVTLSAFIMQHGNIPGARLSHRRCRLYARRQRHPARELAVLWKTSISGSSTGCAMPRHPSHFSVNDALSWIDRFKPRRAVITNMHSDLDYEVLRQSLPPNVVPAYDGMRLTLEQAG